MIQKLRVKFVFINMVIVTVMICVIFGLIYSFTRENLENESLDMMRNIASNPFQLGILDEQGEQVRLPYFAVQITAGGELIATSGGYYDLTDTQLLRQLIQAAFESEEHTGVLKAYNLRFYRIVTPGVQRIVFADISSELRTLSNLLKSCVLIGVISFVVFLGISILLAHWTVRPVDRAWRQQRQFVADASHELKTPLTVIMTNAELLQSTDDAQSRPQFVENILTMAHQMRSLVEGLLDLARVDNGQTHTAFSRQDFSRLVSDAVLPFEPVFFEKGLRLSSEVKEGISVDGSAQHLRQLVEILLDNAQKYSAAQGETTVRLQRQGRNHCLLTISNPGAALSATELKNIFKRFYRVDQARSRTGSFGLGLSIAQSTVQAHHGKIWAESAGGQNTFYVQLPTV